MAILRAQEASSSTSVYAYDVFLSFRGKVVRKNFLDHLYKALVQAGFRTFRDDDEIERGESLMPELEKAIKNQGFRLLCFPRITHLHHDELVMILKCRSTSRHEVLPVFYDVSPSEIRNQKGRTGEAFDGYVKQCEAEIDPVKKMKLVEKVGGWKKALEEVTVLAGSELKNQADGNMLSLQVLHADGIAVNALSTTASQDRLGHACSQSSVSRSRIRPQTFLYSLPRTIVNLSLVRCRLYEDSVPSAFGNQPLLKELDLSNNFFGTLPDSIGSLSNLKSLMIRSCRLLRSILGLPCGLEYLDMESCYSVKKVSFQSSQTRIAKVRSEYCEDMDEIEGIFKIEPIGQVDGKIIKSMGLDIESMENIEVALLDLWNTRMRPIQGLHEFGIFSTFIPGGMVPSCFSDKSKGSSISFSVSSLPNLRIRCLNVFFVYYLRRGFVPEPILLTKILNRKKGLTWIYCPFFVGSPYEGNDMTWLSQWNFGNDQLEGGDEVTVSVHVGDLKVKECGINIVYEEQVENDEEDTDDNNRYFFGNEVIGGDLSNFQLSSGAYFLSRRIILQPERCHVDAILEAFKDVADIKGMQCELKKTLYKFLDVQNGEVF
ncbi:LOW QUALITY PROTEIN: hypothetical protein LguiB_021721 [Lonicera macranthoides]